MAKDTKTDTSTDNTLNGDVNGSATQARDIAANGGIVNIGGNNTVENNAIGDGAVVNNDRR